MKPSAVQLCCAVTVVLFLSACTTEEYDGPLPRPSPASVAAGRGLIARYGCGSCHAIPGIRGAGATTTPPLDRFYERSYIAGRLPNTWENLIQWIQNPQQIEPGNAMPNLGVTQDEAHDIAAYLYHEPTIDDYIIR